MNLGQDKLVSLRCGALNVAQGVLEVLCICDGRMLHLTAVQLRSIHEVWLFQIRAVQQQYDADDVFLGPEQLCQEKAVPCILH